MRIGVYFSPWGRTALPTGVGRHALEMVRSLGARTDVDVSLLASSSDFDAAQSVAADRAGDAVVHRLPGNDRLSRFLFIGLRCCPVDRWVNGLDWIYCSKEQPIATRRVRLAVNVHDALAFEPQINGLNNHPSWRSRSRWLHAMKHIRRADLVTTVSEFTKQRLVEFCQVDPQRIVVAGNGVSDVFYREAQPADQEVLRRYNVQSKGYFFASGSLTRRKGGDLLLEAQRILKQTGCQIPILLSGRRHDPDLLAEYQSQQAASGDGSFRLLGFIPDEDQAVLLTHALALVFPSRYEGFGIPALEAMAAGTIAVCSRIPALTETAGDCGCYVEPNAADQLAEVMQSLINGSVPRERYVSAGRNRAQEFRWERCASRVVEAMSRLGD